MSFLRFKASRDETQVCQYCADQECRYVTRSRVFNLIRNAHRPSCVDLKEEIEGERIVWNAGNTSCHERDGLGDKDVRGKTNQRESRKTMNQKISGVKETSTTSPSKYVTRMSYQENRMMRKKNCNITPFVHLSPRLNDQTSDSKRARVLQRSWMTERGKDVQLDSHQ